MKSFCLNKLINPNPRGAHLLLETRLLVTENMLLCFFVDDKNRWLLASDRMIGLSKLEIPTILSLRSLALLMLRIRTEDLICWNNVALVTAWRRDS